MFFYVLNTTMMMKCLGLFDIILPFCRRMQNLSTDIVIVGCITELILMISGKNKTAHVLLLGSSSVVT